ncbi:MAG TPA: glycosyltransferase family 2 protein [Steroidobacteraceae bacterium]|nr:glycosyltransferase family 2 protein [Steroidobacteraceae bacterium]
MRTALVISTYERPDALAAVLDSVARQRAAPDEIVIADDGSGAPTRELITRFTRRSSVPVRAVSQPHAGFRLTRLRNLAIAACTADFLVFIDGDMLLHTGFVADHRRHARARCFTQGVRVRADEALTAKLIHDPRTPLNAWTPGLGALRRTYLLRSRPLASATRQLANRFIAIKGCNQAFWRADLVRVNGFNEAIEGWGPEDKELAARLTHAGIERQTLMFGGIAVHLHHPAAARDALPANQNVLSETLRERRTWCERGLDAHLT